MRTVPEQCGQNKTDPGEISGPNKIQERSRGRSSLNRYFECGPLELAGGQGVLDDVPGVPGVVELPEVDGEPGLLAEPLEAPGVPGKFPHGAPEGFPGVVFGFTVDGVVLLPELGGFVEFEPGTVDGVVGVGLGVVGVDGLPGGVAVFPGVGAVPGVWVCPALPEPPAGDVPPAGAACAETQTAQNRSVESKVSFLAIIKKPPALRFLIPLTAKCPLKESMLKQFSANRQTDPIGAMPYSPVKNPVVTTESISATNKTLRPSGAAEFAANRRRRKCDTSVRRSLVESGDEQEIE